MCSTFMYSEQLICRLHQRMMAANGQPESEPESGHVTNGVCNGSEAPLTLPAGSLDQQRTVPSSHRLPLPADDFDLLSDAASQDGLGMTSDGSDVINGNYVSSGEDQIPSPPTSQFSEEAVQIPVSVDIAISTEEIPTHTKQRLVSSDEKAQSRDIADAAVKSTADITVMDARQAAVPTKDSETFNSDEAVRNEKDTISLVASDKISQAEVLTAAITGESVISSDRTEIPTSQVVALEYVSTDASTLPTKESGKPGEPAFPAGESEVLIASDEYTGRDDHDYKDSTQELPSAISTKKPAQQPVETAAEDVAKDSTQELPPTISTKKPAKLPVETAAEDVTKKLHGAVDVAESEECVESSYLADKVAADAVSVEHGRSSGSKEISLEVVTDTDHAVRKTHVTDGDYADMSVVGLGTQPSTVSQELRDTPIYSSGRTDVRQDTDVGTSRKISEYDEEGGRTIPRKISEYYDEGGRIIPQQEVTTVTPSSEASKPSEPLPCRDVDVSISGGLSDQDKSRQAETVGEGADIGDVIDSGDSDLNRSDGRRDLSVGFPNYDHYDNGVEDEDEEYDLGHHGDMDKVDSAADDDDDTTSSQVAPLSVKMHETAKGKYSGSKTSTVVCARPSRGSGTRSSKTPSDGALPKAVATAEVPHADESNEKKERDDQLKHHIVVDGKEPSVGPSADEKDIQSITPHHVEENTGDLKPFDSELVQSDRSVLLHSSEELASAETLSGNVAGHVPAMQESLAVETRDDLPTTSRQSVTDQSEIGGTEPQLPDSRQAHAELAVLTPWEIQQRTDDDDDKKYSTHQHPQGTSIAEGDRSVRKDKADDTGVSSVSKAVKTGLMAVAAAPYLAGIAIADALRSDAHPATNIPHSHVQNDQHPTEMARFSTDDEQRKTFDDRADVSQSSGSRAADDKLNFSKPNLPSQLDKDTVQQVDSADGRRGEVSDTAADLTSSLNVDAVIEDSSASLNQPSDTSKVNFHQPLLEPSSAVAGSKQPALPEMHDDGSNFLQSSMKMEPLLPVMASTQPLEITTTSTVPSVVYIHPSLLPLDSTPLTAASTQLSPHTTHSTASSVVSAVSMESSLSITALVQPVMKTTQAMLPTVESTVQSTQRIAPTAASAQLSELPPQFSAPGLDSTTLSVATTQTSLPAVTSSAWTTETTISLVMSNQPLTVTTQTVPSAEPLSETSQSTLLRKESTTISVLPSAAAVSTASLSQPSAVITWSATQTVPSSETFKSSMLSEESSSIFAQASAATVSNVSLSQPFMAETAESTAAAVPSTQVSAQPSQVSLPTVATSVPFLQTADTTSPAAGASPPNAEPTKETLQATLPTPTLPVVFGLPTDTTALTVASSQPLMVPVVVSTKPSKDAMLPTPSTTASTQLSLETVQSIVPAQQFTETVPSSLPAEVSAEASRDVYVSVGSASSLIDSLQATSDVVSSTTTTSSTSSAVMSEQGSVLSLPLSTQLPDVTSQTAVPSALSSDQCQVVPRVKPSVIPSESSQLSQVPAHDETGDRFIGNETTSLHEVQRDESSFDYFAATFPDVESQQLLSGQKRAEVDSQTTQLEQYKQPVITDSEQPSAVLLERDETHSELHDDRDQNVSGRFQPENEPRDSGLSSVAHSVKTAVQVGLFGLVGAPVLAGMAVADALRSKPEERQDVQTTRPQVYVDGRDNGGDQLQRLDMDKEMKDKPEIAAHRLIISGEIQNHFGRVVESTGLPGLSLSEALLSPLYDQQHNCFIEPTTGRRISLVTAIQLGLIDGNNKQIADLSSGEVISVLEALNRGIIDSETGMVSVDGEACVPLNEALASGLIMDDTDGDLMEMAASIGTTAGRHVWNEATDITDSTGELLRSTESRRRQSSRQLSQPLKLVQLFDLGLYDPVSGEFRDPRSSDSLSLADAIRCRLLDKNSVVVNDPQSEEVLSLEESIRGGLVSGNTSLVHDTSTSENIPLTEALRRGILVPRPMSIATAVNIGLYDEANGMFFDPTNGLYFALEEAVEGGLIDPHSLVIDPATGKAMAVAAALACGVLDARHGNVVNIHTGEVIPLKQMAVSSQAVFGSQPVGVSNQVAATSADVEAAIKSAAGPDVHKISESRIVGTSGPSSDVLVTPGDGVGTNDVGEDDQLVVASADDDTSKMMKVTGVADAASEAASDSCADALRGDEMFSNRLHQHTDHVLSSADITADARSSTGELTSDVMTSAGDDAGKKQQAESETVQAVLPGEQLVNKSVEAAAAHPTAESSEPVVRDESYLEPASAVSPGAPVCDESLKTPAGDDLSREMKRHDDTQPAYEDSFPASASTDVTDETAHKPIVSDVSGPPTSTPVLTASTSLNISRQFHPSVSVRPEDSGRPAFAVDGISSTVTLQHRISLVSASVSVSPVQAVDVNSAGTVGDVELQRGAVARPLQPVGHVSTDMTQTENTYAATRQLHLPDSMHAGVGLDPMTQVEFIPAQDHTMDEPLESLGPHDTQQLQEVKHIEVKPVTSDARTDYKNKIDLSRDSVSEGDRKMDDGMKYDLKKDEQSVIEWQGDVLQPSTVVEVEVKTLPSDELMQDGMKKDEAQRDDGASKDDLKKDSQNVADYRDDTQLLSNIVQVEVKTLPSDDGKKDDSYRGYVFKDDAKKDLPEKEESQKDTVNIVESQDDMNQLSSIVDVELKRFPEEDVKKVVAKKDEAKRDVESGDDLKEVDSKKDVAEVVDAQKDVQDVVESRGVQQQSSVVQIAVKRLRSDDLRKDEAGNRDDILTEGTDRNIARKDNEQKVSTDVLESSKQPSSVTRIDVEPLPTDDIKKDEAECTDVSKGYSKKAVSNEPQKDAEPQDDVQQPSSTVLISVKPLVCDDGTRGGLTEDAVERDSVTKDKMKKDETGEDAMSFAKPRSDVELLSSMMQIEAKTPPCDVSKQDSSTVVKRDVVVKGETKKDETERDAMNVADCRSDVQQLSRIMLVEAETPPCSVGKKDDMTEDVKRDDIVKDSTKKASINEDGAQSVVEFHDNVYQPSITQVEVKPFTTDTVQKDILNKDEAKKQDISGDDSKKHVPKDDSAPADAINIAESRDDVQHLSNIIEVEVKSLAKHVSKKDDVEEDDLKGDDASKGDDETNKTRKDVAEVVRPQVEVDNTKAAREGVVDVVQKPLDVVDTVRQYGGRIDTDISDKKADAGHELVVMDTGMQQQQQQQFMLSTEVLTEEKVSTDRPHEDELAAAEDDDSELRKKDLTTDRDLPVTSRVLVSSNLMNGLAVFFFSIHTSSVFYCRHLCQNYFL